MLEASTLKTIFSFDEPHLKQFAIERLNRFSDLGSAGGLRINFKLSAMTQKL